MDLHQINRIIIIGCFLMRVSGCAYTGVKLPIDTASAAPGIAVTLKGEQKRLIGTPLQIGQPLPSAMLFDAS